MLERDGQAGALISREVYLKRVQQAFREAGSRMEEIHHRFNLDHRRLVEHYLEGRAWLICDLDVVLGNINKRAALACLNLKHAVCPNTPMRIAETHLHARKARCGKQQSVLVDVAEFVQSP